MLLPFLFKKIVKTSAKAGGGKNWYPEKDEVLNSFILHIKVKINLRIKLYCQFKITFNFNNF